MKLTVLLFALSLAGAWAQGWQGMTAAPMTMPPPDEWTCDYENEMYALFDPIPTGTPCMICLCLKEFDGCLDEAVCKNITCPESKWEGKCAPVFVGGPSESCCPIGYRCPTRKDRVMPATTMMTPNTTMMATTTMAAKTTMKATTTMAPMTTTSSKPTSTNKPTTQKTPTTTEEPGCMFGHLHMQVGDQLEDSRLENTVCTCEEPPGLTCVMTPPCP